ncbi:MAG: ferrous iron transport protein A [Candidatus Omnitrophota bacterium]|nr:MAG: ferrous iron transport protein A [Candidatus Omnitrophota bacterium]
MRKKLSQMKYGEKGIVKDIDNDLKERIAGMGIRIGKELKMITKQPMKGPVVVLVDGARTSLGVGIADKIKVEVAE